MMNDNDKLNAVFDPRDGDPHHIAAQEDDGSASNDIHAAALVVFAVLAVTIISFAWWLS